MEHQSSNPIIADFKATCAGVLRGMFDQPLEVEGKQARWWLTLLNDDPIMSNYMTWGHLTSSVTASDVSHARRVLERIAEYRYSTAGERIDEDGAILA